MAAYVGEVESKAVVEPKERKQVIIGQQTRKINKVEKEEEEDDDHDDTPASKRQRGARGVPIGVKMKTKAKANPTKGKAKGEEKELIKHAPNHLLAGMAIYITGMPPNQPDGKTASYIIRGVRDGTEGCVLRYRGPWIRPRDHHVNTIRDQKELWPIFLEKLGLIDTFFSSMGPSERSAWISQNAQCSEQSLLQGALEQDANATPTVTILNPGSAKSQLIERIKPDELQRWIDEETAVPLATLVERLGRKDPDDPDSSGRNLFFLHGWWSCMPNPTVRQSFVDIETIALLGKLRIGWAPRGPASASASDEARDELTWETLIPDSPSLKAMPIQDYLWCGPRVYLAVEKGKEKPEAERKDNHEVLHNHYKERLDRLYTKEARVTFAEYKSGLQKIIRYQPDLIEIDDSDLRIPAPTFLRDLIRRLAYHRGGFVPDLHTVVSGPEALCKRLAIIGFEDARIDPTDAEWLLTIALLFRHHPDRFKMNEAVLKRIQTIAENLLKCTSVYHWDEKKSAPAIGSTKALTATSRSSLLLDELGSFSGDLNMVRHIAAQEVAAQGKGKKQNQAKVVKVVQAPVAVSKPKPKQRLMPVWHLLDQHCCPDMVYELEPSVLKEPASKPKLASVPFGQVFHRIFSEVTGLNPRRIADLEAAMEKPFAKAVRATQKRVWMQRVAQSSQPQVPSPSPSPPYSKEAEAKLTVEKRWTLSDHMLRGAIGHFEVGKHMVVLASLEPKTWKVFARPNRTGKSKDVSEKEKVETVRKANAMLEKGEVRWRAFAPPYGHIASGAIITHKNGIWCVGGEPWDTVKVLRRAMRIVNEPVPLNSDVDLTDVLVANADQRCLSIIDDLWPIHEQRERNIALLRVSDFLDQRSTHIRFHKLARNGGSASTSNELALFQDVQVFQFFKSLTSLYPSILRFDGLRSFRIMAPYAVPALKQLIRDAALRVVATTSGASIPFTATPAPISTRRPAAAAAAAASSSAPVAAPAPAPAAAAASIGTYVWPPICLEGDGRTAEPHQARTHELMKQRDQRGGNSHFLWEDVGSGKTKCFGDYLVWRLKEGRLGSVIIYTLPPSAVASVKAEFEKYHFPVNIWSPLGGKKHNPFLHGAVNLIVHDHMRLVIDQCLELLQTPNSIFCVDEAHLALNNSLRTNACRRSSATASAFVLITGTPIITTNLSALIPWLQKMIPEYPVTLKNFWCAALTGDTMIHQNPEWQITEVEEKHTASFTAAETKQYLALMPKQLGGVKEKSSAQEVLEGFGICESACLRWLAEHAKEESLVFVKTRRQQEWLKAAWCRCHHKDADEVFEVRSDNPINLTPETIQKESSLKRIKLVIATRAHTTGYNVNAWANCYRIPYVCQLAEETQARGRIRRKGNPHPQLNFHTVVDPMGIFAHRAEKQGLALELLKVLRSALQSS